MRTALTAPALPLATLLLAILSLRFDPATSRFAGRPVAEWLDQAKSGSEPDRCTAIMCLAGVYAGPFTGSLDPFPTAETRRDILQRARTGWVSRRAGVILPTLIAALDDRSTSVRGYAAFALRTMYGEALQAAAALRRHLDDRDAGVRVAVAHALYFIDFETDAPLRVLIEALQDPIPEIRRCAVQNLGLMGADARPALAVLERAATDPEERVRTEVAWALPLVR